MRLFTLLLIGLILTACSPALKPEPIQHIHVSRDNLIYLNTALQLRAYPESTVQSWAQANQQTAVSFSSPIAINSVYLYFHQQLLANGWQRTALQEKTAVVNARYQRNDGTFRLFLEHKNGMYHLITR